MAFEKMYQTLMMCYVDDWTAKLAIFVSNALDID